MFAQRKSHLRSVSSSTTGLNTLNTSSSASPGRRVQSWVYGERDPASRPGRPVRSFSAESLHGIVIPQTKDIDSQFQTVLGKCLFDQAVHVAEDQGAGVGHHSPVTTRGMTPMPGSGSPGSSRPASSQGSTGNNSPMMDSRTTIRIRPTRCSSPLVKGSRSFDSYINNGSLDQVAIAKARGPLEPPKPCIYKYIHRVKTASNNNLNDFSLKSEFTDSLRENEREKYWKRKVEEKIIEEEMNERKEREKAEMMIILEDMKKEYIERKAKEEAEIRNRQEELDILAKEEEREARLAASTENQCIADDTISVISSSSKSSKKRSSKKGGRSKKDKNSKKGKSSSKKSAKKRASVSPSRDDGNEGSGRNTPQPILKPDGRRQSSAGQSENSSGGTDKTKRVTFRKNLVSSKTFKSCKPVSPRKGSPKKPFPGSSSSAGSDSRSLSPTRGDKKSRSSSPKGKRTRGKGSKKGSKKKSTVDSKPQTETQKEPEPVPEPVELEKPLEQETEEPKEPVVIIVDEPPEFIPAADYKTRNQMVEEWLYYRTSSANRQANPPIL